MVEKTDQEKIEAYNKMLEGARRGGKSEKHFSPESKELQREGARRGGASSKHFTSESKKRQIEGARIGGQRSVKSRRNGSCNSTLKDVQ